MSVASFLSSNAHHKSVSLNFILFLSTHSDHRRLNTPSLIGVNRHSIRPHYLKDFFIQNSGAKDGNAFCVDDGLVASGEGPGNLLLTVHEDGDTFLFHADSYAMPSVQWGRKRGQKYSHNDSKCDILEALFFAGITKRSIPLLTFVCQILTEATLAQLGTTLKTGSWKQRAKLSLEVTQPANLWH